MNENMFHRYIPTLTSTTNKKILDNATILTMPRFEEMLVAMQLVKLGSLISPNTPNA